MSWPLMLEAWGWLKDFSVAALFVPIDSEDREQRLATCAAALGRTIQTDWAPVGVGGKRFDGAWTDAECSDLARIFEWPLLREIYGHPDNPTAA